jgi:hypothetical protein
MRFGLSFDMNGAAFDGGDNSVDEVVRILHKVADQIDYEGTAATLRGVPVWDVNGNTVGKWEVTDNE